MDRTITSPEFTPMRTWMERPSVRLISSENRLMVSCMSSAA